MYGIYKVLRIRIEKDRIKFGKFFVSHECYPSNEDFGSIAWCYKDKDLAEERYNAI